MDPRDRWRSTLAAQLGHPRGLPGLVVGRMLNRANRAAIDSAVGALDIPPGAVLADLGFGGGLGLELLLSGLEDGGEVHGVDQSTAMLAAATRRFRRQLESGLLVLHEAPLDRLPLETSSLDGAITLNTLYFVTDLAGLFDEWARVLKPSGQLVIGLGDPDTMARQPLTAHGFHVRPLVQVTNALHDANLEVDQHQRVGTGEDAVHLLVTQPY